MRVKDLITALPASGWTYQGEWEQPFSEWVLKPPKKPNVGQFLPIRDASWPQITGVTPLPSRKKREARIQRAFDQGAAGVICSWDLKGSAVLEGKNVFFADDSFALTCQLTAAVRQSLQNQRITAITGSAGKTTTKSMLVHALRAVGVSRISSNPGNDNLYRMCLRRISQSHRHRHTVLEVSSSALKAFQASGFSVSPDVSIVTSIAEAHLDYMGSMENLVKTKSDLFQLPPAGGTSIINRDALHADVLVRRAVSEGCQLVTYGESEEATIRLVSWDPYHHDVVAMVGQQRVEYRLGVGGKHNALNSLAVIAALRAHRIRNWREAVDSLADFEALSGRGQSHSLELPSGAKITLIDEAYNANPASIRSSLAALASMQLGEGQRRVAVLGDVMELGEASERVHRSLAESVHQAGLDRVFLFGEHMRALYEELKSQTRTVHHWPDLETMREELPGLLQSGDAVLMKASGATGLSGWVAELTGSAPA